MALKIGFRDSKGRTGRMGVGKGRSSGNGGESTYSNERKRVSVWKSRSSGNGDENVESGEQRGRRSIEGKNRRTERGTSSRNEVRDSKPRYGRVGTGKGRSSGSGGENMYSKDRERVSVRKTRGSGNGDENLDSEEQRGRRSIKGKSSQIEGFRSSGNEVKDSKPRNGRVGIGKGRSSGNGDENVNSKNQREKLENSRNERLDIDSREKMKVRGGKQGINSRGKDGKKDIGNDRNEEFQSDNVSTKRKRVYANQTLGNETSTKDFLKNELKRRLLTEKRMGKDKFENSGSESSLVVQKKYKGSDVVDKKTRLAYNTKKSVKKNGKGNKVTGNDNAEEAEQPRKNKRIRIDPYDTSNKRIDDSLITTKDAEEKKKDLPKSGNDVELSMNAQFRAICPSQSILSYVEDNLLGRRREIEIKRAGYNTDLTVPLDNIPFSPISERERIEEPAFRNKMEFFAAAKISSSFPPIDLPEIAFAGRSNVGKSSMLNALTRKWNMARTSDKPGLTQSINFFKLGTKLCLVDLPGYGFAYAKEEVKESWEELVKEYVSTRVGLKRVCLLVDTKWGMKQRDYELIDLMESSKTKYQIVLTKTDLVFPIDVARRAMQIEENLKGMKSAVQPAIMVSSKSGAGIRSFRTALSKIARYIKP